jgi:hypothetical protein
LNLDVNICVYTNLMCSIFFAFKIIPDDIPEPATFLSFFMKLSAIYLWPKIGRIGL